MSHNFTEVFKQLVPHGKATLVMKTDPVEQMVKCGEIFHVWCMKGKTSWPKNAAWNLFMSSLLILVLTPFSMRVLRFCCTLVFILFVFLNLVFFLPWKVYVMSHFLTTLLSLVIATGLLLLLPSPNIRESISTKRSKAVHLIPIPFGTISN